jgi:ATP-binding cassette subfamily B (MDR/TAP) protein 1
MYIQVDKVQQGLVTNMTAVLTKVSMGVSGIIMALTIGYTMAIVMILFLPVMMLSGWVRGYFMKQKEMYAQTKKVKLDSDVIEVFDNIKTVKMLAGETHEVDRYQTYLSKERDTNWAHGWKGALAFTFFFFCIIANYALGFWYGTKLVSDRTVNAVTG